MHPDGPADEPGSESARGCDRQGCTCAGEHRAPRGRMPEAGHFWFCLEHIREYNAGWDFYAGMSRDEIDGLRKDDVTWGRPTWRFGTGDGHGLHAWHTRDDFDMFGAGGWGTHGEARSGSAERPVERPARPEERQALATLGLTPGTGRQDVRKRYKELVKRHHPDTNGGDRRAEERLKRIIAAYSVLAARGTP